MTMTDTHPRILSPEQLAEWTPAHRRMYARRLPKSWPRVREMLARSERALETEPTENEPPAQRPPSRVTAKRIVACCAEEGGISVAEMMGPRKTKSVFPYRYAAAYLIRTHRGMSFQEIGKLIGRDHSSVMVAIQKVTDDLAEGGKRWGPIVRTVENMLGIVDSADNSFADRREG